eukprot:CAMPEP_0119109288 /NCGR_PEP_ID=MMETSP1180-20130426/17829_1 /TAXON_ID=3052 ORGANISM="Chlamydomonas cf sp, Strain CCMP681" /NCGR_SAMPLE_ID=MMETSP1180 /ASSEMBLY_ACC=CAM_ASM_000741 /LENGTH=236 /DNA_ID=CAMNT_0007095029 /DNA_START=21 /DNA_END=731 /DNA_ORIENTATION=+
MAANSMVTANSLAVLGEFGLGTLKSFGMILASEIGDKTFFIAAIMAMRNPRFSVFLGAAGALAAMTILSVVLGVAAPALISKTYTHYAATALFFFFGLKSLYDAILSKGAGGEELEEVEKELAEKGDSTGKIKSGGTGSSLGAIFGLLLSPVFIKAFTLTFVGEWGDRSQIATIGLAASEDPYGVALGGVLGHAVCTMAAVLGGRHLATHINEHVVQICGGVLFLLFGAHAVWTGP